MLSAERSMALHVWRFDIMLLFAAKVRRDGTRLFSYARRDLPRSGFGNASLLRPRAQLETGRISGRGGNAMSTPRSVLDSGSIPPGRLAVSTAHVETLDGLHSATKVRIRCSRIVKGKFGRSSDQA